MGPLLAHDDLCAFLGKEESRTSTDSLCEPNTLRYVIVNDGDGQMPFHYLRSA